MGDYGSHLYENKAEDIPLLNLAPRHEGVWNN
jgi:hypothetical protein